MIDMDRIFYPEELLLAKKEYLFPCLYHFYKNPPVIVSAQDVWLFDHEGKGYLDCYSGVTVVNAGHSHPEIVAAISRQASRLDHTTTIYLTGPMFQLARKLAQIAPGGLKRSFFCASGSEANETALLLASLATGRHGFIALSGSLHGRTKWGMSVTGLDMWRTDRQLLSNIHFVSPAHCQRCQEHCPATGGIFPCVEAIEHTILEIGPDSLAALIAEPIQGNGGIIVPPAGYWQQVRNLLDRYGLLLIFDEVQTAMNRTGRWFAGEHWDTVPDIMTMAKALGNGMPIAVTMTTDAIASAYTRPGASTFGANPISCAAALATIEVHERQKLGRRAYEMGFDLQERLIHAEKKSSHLAHVRGKGLMLGVEVVDQDGKPDASRCDAYLERLKEEGFLLGKTGTHRNVLTLMPPLTITTEHVSAIGDAMARL